MGTLHTPLCEFDSPHRFPSLFSKSSLTIAPSPPQLCHTRALASHSNDTFNGTSLNTPVFESVPQYYNQTFNSTNEPFPNARQIYTPATQNGTNATGLDYPFQPSGGLLIKNPTYTVKSNFDFQSLNLALNQGGSRLTSLYF